VFRLENVPGMLLGLAVIVGATWLLVRGHLARERDEAETADRVDQSPPRSSDEPER
jgi:hypothetical protein